MLRIDIRDTRKKGERLGAFVTFAAGEAGSRLSTLPEEVRGAAAAAPPEAGADDSLFMAPLSAGAAADRLYVIGAGAKTELTPRRARSLLRNALRLLERNGERSAVVDFPFAIQRMSPAEAREFVFLTLHAASYSFPAYKTEKPERRSLERVLVSTARGVFADGTPGDDLKTARALAGANRFVRDLGNTPSNDMPPRLFAEAAVAEAKKRGLPVTVFDKKRIEKERMGGLLAVARGSAEEPRFVIVEHAGGKKGEAPIVLVGKGVTFDSGGISIKPAERMGDMKWDMMGAATAVGSVLAAADLGLPVNLVALAPLTENLPSGTAYKPGDIVRFRNGKTAEIDNTDAEGRVILADALDYACGLSPRVILDYATLTGAALVALGLEAAIVFTDDDALAAELMSAGERTDERLWRLPMWDDYKEAIRSEWADFKNTGGRYGGSINGAMFLKQFVPAAHRWAHLDIAPTAYFEKDHAGYAVGATAFGVALTLRWLRDLPAAGGATRRARGKAAARHAG